MLQATVGLTSALLSNGLGTSAFSVSLLVFILNWRCSADFWLISLASLLGCASPGPDQRSEGSERIPLPSFALDTRAVMKPRDQLTRCKCMALTAISQNLR